MCNDPRFDSTLKFIYRKTTTTLLNSTHDNQYFSFHYGYRKTNCVNISFKLLIIDTFFIIIF